MERELEFYTIYEQPSDYPSAYVLRRSTLQKIGDTMQNVPEAEPLQVCKTLAEVRSKLPDIGLVNIGRMAGDDPIIYEVWI